MSKYRRFYKLRSQAHGDSQDVLQLKMNFLHKNKALLKTARKRGSLCCSVGNLVWIIRLTLKWISGVLYYFIEY